jgi:type IV pilus assembly protein PilW
MVALALGLLLTIAMASVYITSKSSFTRQQQLSSIQQNVRIAFEYLSSDARMVGHLGCFTGLSTATADGLFNSAFATPGIGNNYAIGVEGYEYTNATANALTLTSSAPSNDTTAALWSTNVSGTATTIPVTTISTTGLTPGSDVLVIRTVAGRPVRLSSPTASAGTTLGVENLTGGTCSNGSAKVSGFCANSHGLIASCSRARVFQVQSIAAQTLTLTGTLGADPVYTTTATEVFPMQTLVYYVAASSNGTGTSLYRRTFDGDNAAGLEQELIDGVENMQVRYGVDTDATPDGIVNSYVNANAVTNWNTVVAVRMSLLMRASTPVEADTTVATSGVVNGVTVTYPSTGKKYDRRVFTTTVAVRNKISYF